MLVKILTMHRVINYGSYMQAYALKRTIESYGCNVEFCDFKKGKPIHAGEKVRKEKLQDKLKKIPSILLSPLKYINKKKFTKKRNKIFRQDYFPILGIQKRLNLDYRADLIIIGSDEVFNYTQNHGFGYVPELFGHDLKSNVIVSYAASAGYTNIQDIQNDNFEKVIREGLEKFTDISVRDENTQDIIYKYSNHKPHMVLDPTLIYDFSKEYVELDIINSIGEYLLVYAYTDRLDDNKDIKIIRQLADEKSLKVVSVGFYHHWCDYNLVVTPFEMLSVFNKSYAVITDTFHGTIFSIKTKKRFVSYLREISNKGSNSNKLHYLLKQLNLKSRIYDENKSLLEQIDKDINYTSIYSTLEELRAYSINFLDNIMRCSKSRMSKHGI